MKIFLCKSEHKDGKKNNEHDTSVMACCWLKHTLDILNFMFNICYLFWHIYKFILNFKLKKKVSIYGFT
jgi:hypothetical protein